VHEQKQQDEADEEDRVGERNGDDLADTKMSSGVRAQTNRRERRPERELRGKVRADENFEERDDPRQRRRIARSNRSRWFESGAGRLEAGVFGQVTLAYCSSNPSLLHSRFPANS